MEKTKKIEQLQAMQLDYLKKLQKDLTEGSRRSIIDAIEEINKRLDKIEGVK